MLFRSTRNRKDIVSPSLAIVRGLSLDGGLYVPEEIPKLDISLRDLSTKSYVEIAYEVMKLYFTDFTCEELKDCIENAYLSGFSKKNTVDIKKLRYKDYNEYILELYHGKTLAFKDMALSILPHLIVKASKKNNIKEELIVLTATSGDTGKAALEGFSNVKNTEIVVFYPKYGVSRFQERQMVTQEGDNVHIVGINGNFDDAQTAIKKVMNDDNFKRNLQENNMKITSANSINIGRLIPQIVYYVYSYVKLLYDGEIKEGEKVNVVVPTGNFGNILAAYYAKNMGIPFGNIICASNKNNVLYDFFTTGEYNINRNFYVTTSPSMDILISSNLERFIDVITGGNTDLNNRYMKELSENGFYKIDKLLLDKLNEILTYYCDTDETSDEIRDIYDRFNYLIDPHTAVATLAHKKYIKSTNDKKKTIISSTASPYKFAETILKALYNRDVEEKSIVSNMNDIEIIDGKSKPSVIESVLNNPIKYNEIIEIKDIYSYLERELFNKK